MMLFALPNSLAQNRTTLLMKKEKRKKDESNGR